MVGASGVRPTDSAVPTRAHPGGSCSGSVLTRRSGPRACASPAPGPGTSAGNSGPRSLETAPALTWEKSVLLWTLR